MNSTHKRILFLFNRSPFYHHKRNDKHQFQIYSALKDNFETKILTFGDKSESNIDQISVRLNNKKFSKVINFLFRHRSPRITHYKSKEFDHLFTDLLISFDPHYIYVEHVLMMQYLVNKNLSNKILFFNDESNLFVDSKHLRGNLYQRLRNVRLSKFEITACNKSDYILTITDEERKFLEKDYNYKNVLTVPCGIDTNYFSFNWKPVSSKSILFIGDYDHYPNRAAARILSEKIFNKIKHSNVKLIFVGRNTHRICKYKSQNIEIYEDVKDIRDFYWSSSIFVAPIFTGAGMRIKILEAASCGIPIVMTSVANLGINLRNQSEVFIEDTIEGITKRVKQLLYNNINRGIENMTKLARKRIVENYDEKLIIKHIKEIFNNLDKNNL